MKINKDIECKAAAYINITKQKGNHLGELLIISNITKEPLFYKGLTMKNKSFIEAFSAVYYKLLKKIKNLKESGIIKSNEFITISVQNKSIIKEVDNFIKEEGAFLYDDIISFQRDIEGISLVYNPKIKTLINKFKKVKDNSFKYHYSNKNIQENYRGLIFLDLEINYSKKSPNGEVVSIGAIKTDKNYEIIDSFYRLIKPRIDSTLSERCREITKLKQKDIDSSKSFEEVFTEFHKFCGKGKYLFVAWSTADVRVIKSNNKLGGFRLEIVNQIRKNYWDFQQTFSYEYIKKKNVISLDKALKIFNIEFNGIRHNALDDTLNLYRVFKAWESSGKKSKVI